MVKIYDCLDTAEALTGLRLARQAVGRGDLIVIPTDTVYGIAADAFNPAAVQKLLDAKGRGRTSPPPVLVPGIETLDALAEQVTPEMRALAEELLRESGPLAVSSANLTGQPAALTATEAHDSLGDRIAVYLASGESSGSRVGSTIVDATPTVTGKPVRVLRDGTVSRDAIRAIVGAIEGDE